MTTRMTIPEIRSRLYEIAVEEGLPEVATLADQMWRRRPGRDPVHPVSRRMTDELRDQIREYATLHPDEPEDRVGMRFGVNQGRVSEALFGFRR
jgi:hypothetical protein